MSFIHTIIKIQYIKEGYVEGYPPHLLSDVEMVDAFLPLSYPITEEAWTSFLEDDIISYFKDHYPLIDAEFEEPYKELVSSIAYYVQQLRDDTQALYTLPDWVYSYMLGSVIGPESNEQELGYLFDLLSIKDLDLEFDKVTAERCYQVSQEWLNKMIAIDEHRKPTMFGEPHVIKAQRLKEVAV